MRPFLKSFAVIVLLMLALNTPILCSAQAQPPRSRPPAAKSQGSPKMKAAAQDAANRWLALADAGNYAQNWDAASPMFQKSIEKAQWEKAMQSNRAPYGKLFSRTITSAVYTTELPGAPDGKYYVLSYKSSFEHKKAAEEKITVSQGEDGQWKVSGYFIS